MSTTSTFLAMDQERADKLKAFLTTHFGVSRYGMVFLQESPDFADGVVAALLDAMGEDVNYQEVGRYMAWWIADKAKYEDHHEVAKYINLIHRWGRAVDDMHSIVEDLYDVVRELPTKEE